MDRKIKFNWNFYGTDAQGTADHHVIHLKEFCKNKYIIFHQCHTKSIEDGTQAFLIINEKDAINSHPLLKPHEAFVYEDVV